MFCTFRFSGDSDNVVIESDDDVDYYKEEVGEAPEPGELKSVI